MDDPDHHAFEVDLRGVVDLLSHHLYSSPRVYLRELLQNAVDATTARTAIEPSAPRRIEIDTAGGTFRIADSGIGLDEEEVHRVLATIGRSSKRDPLGFARSEYLGQFGIGLLSCFLVADHIEVVTRSVHADTTLTWTGSSDGRYVVRSDPAVARDVGTTVTLRPRPGMDQWLAPRTVVDLARSFGELLTVDVVVDGTTVSGRSGPWEVRDDPAGAADQGARCIEAFGFAPLATIDLHVPEAGLRGTAYVLDTATNAAVTSRHRAYLRRMLLSDGVEGLLPPWAFFVRCIVDAHGLRPTASREALFEDDLLEHARDSMGAQVRQWIQRLAATDPPRLAAFLSIHGLGFKALALHDDEMLAIAERWLPFETTIGTVTLRQFRRTFPELRYTRTDDEFRQIAAVAAAQGVGVVNAGFAHDVELIERLAGGDRGASARPLSADELTTAFGAVDLAGDPTLADLVVRAGAVLDPLGCDVDLCAFEPTNLPTLYLMDHAARIGRTRLAGESETGDLWRGILGSLPDPDRARPVLVLNHLNPLVRRVARQGRGDGDLVELLVGLLYGQALLAGRHPLRSSDAALLTRSQLGLIERATSEGDGSLP